MEIARAEGKRGLGVEQLAALAASENVRVRERALVGLGRVGAGNQAAVAIVRDALDDSDVRVRRAAALALGMTGVESAGAALMARYQREPDIETRAVIVEALGRVGDDHALAVFTSALAHAELAEHAAIAMGRFGRRQIPLDDQARRALALAAVPARSQIRHAVAFAFVREHQPGTGALGKEIGMMLDRLASDPDPEVRATAIFALVKQGARAERSIGARAMAARVTAALGDPDWRVRVAAARAAGGAQATADERVALAGHLMREWSALVQDGFASPRIHVLTEALRSLAATPADVELPAPVREALKTLHERAAQVLASPRGNSPEHSSAQLAASTIHCLAASALVAAEATQAETARAGAAQADAAQADATIEMVMQCGGPPGRGMPAHERAQVLAHRLAAGQGGDPAQRLARLDKLFAHQDSRVRAAAIAVIGDIAGNPHSADALVQGVLDMLARALEDPAVEVAGTAADALATLAGKGERAPDNAPDNARAARIASLAAGPLLARARAHTDNIELSLTFMAALAAARVAQAEPLCRHAHGHANMTMRGAARQCLKALTGQDPGPGQATATMALPPVDPADVLGKSLVLTIATSKGDIDVALDTRVAPWHVAALVHLIENDFYRDLLWHRVVPDFVVQGGDPQGSGWGGPAFVIPAEPSAGQFRRGTVGIADAGLDTGGSQWFIMHSRAAHLDGRYTIVGQVIRGQDVVDALMVGDRILAARVAPGDDP